MGPTAFQVEKRDPKTKTWDATTLVFFRRHTRTPQRFLGTKILQGYNGLRGLQGYNGLHGLQRYNGLHGLQRYNGLHGLQGYSDRVGCSLVSRQLFEGALGPSCSKVPWGRVVRRCLGADRCLAIWKLVTIRRRQ